jgi:hypothetical protein
VRGTVYGVRGRGYRVRSTWYGYGVRGTGYGVRGTGYRVQGTGTWYVSSHRKKRTRLAVDYQLISGAGVTSLWNYISA